MRNPRWRPPRKAEILRLQRVAAEHAAFVAAFEARLVADDGAKGKWVPASGLAVHRGNDRWPTEPAITVHFDCTTMATYNGTELRLRGRPKTKTQRRFQPVNTINGDSMDMSYGVLMLADRLIGRLRWWIDQ